MRKSKKLRRLMKSAKMGNPAAQYQLGLWYQIGREVSPDLQMASMWIELAADSEYAAAKEWLADYAFDDNANIQAND